ncbi:hypothetical protein [Mesorhizobium sp. B2-8-9]|uniref:hypothetical protein n=1 Tax=Mesorhizobium sp. B2-8-9 TaxID=2589899 RepID=UPI001129EA55|nr:hypothetical protein [Mesorhizobium sp. B2-8-9]TPI86388.1 hypothetical protein FJ423_00765 [Mesorhizobium sp. B2-8-9]
MSTGSLLAEIKRRKLLVSNLYEGVDGLWRCFLRDKRNEMPSPYRGEGPTAEAALRAAMPVAHAQIPKTEFADLLG